MTPFDLVLLPFPFTDLSATKQRPCLVLAVVNVPGLGGHYVVSMITSQLTGLGFPGDTLIGEWQRAGLPKPSLIRLAKVVTVEKALIRKRLGRLGASDQISVRKRFEVLFARLLVQSKQSASC